VKAFLKSLLLSAACVMIPGSHSAAQNQKTVEVTKGVNVTIPAPWFLANRTGNAVELAYPLQGREPRRKPEQKEKPTTGEEVVTAAARNADSIEQRRTHEEALERLGNIAAEQNERPELLVIAGWAAIHRKRTATLPNPGVEGTPAPQANALFTTTAIAVDTLIVRFETVIAPGSGPELADAAFDIARHVQVKAGNPDVAQRELEKVYGHPVAPTAPRPPSAGDTRRRAPSEMPAPGSTRVQGGVGELEVAVSNDGQHVVVAANSGYSFSDDGGQTFTSGGGTPCIYNRCDGDPSLAVGQSGAFYYSWIGRPFNQAGGTPANGWTDSLSRSTDNGHTYTFRSNAVFCPDTTPNVCTVPDREHIAADRLTGPATGDRVYLVWRNFSNVGLTARIVCSSDGGGTWPTQQTVDTAGDFPRITVGPDGFVYVVYFLYSGANIIINLHKFSTCDSGLTPQAGFPVTVSTAASVPCPMPGLDRCNDGNILSSPTVAVDDLDAQHVYVAWAVSSGAGNENIIVADSVNGGTSFPRSIQVNSAATGRRFMPWVSSYGGVAYVNWYDRRNSTSANNDLTRYYGGPAAVKAGNLVAGTETDISQINDGQCSTWPCAPRSTNDSESCSAQPQLAGRCSHNPPVVGDSFQACDFTTGPACPGTETCLTGGGCPKYGDYNGGTAIAGRRYAAWASATPPPGVTGATSGINVYESSDVLPSDFFVRDWTVNATNHDLGPEPSTNPDFYTSSDVWNQRSSSTPASPVNDWVAGDADANAGGPAGNNNFAFVRVSRRAAASPNAPTINVPVTFLKADYGLGTNYVTVANASLTFNPTDLTKTLSPGIGWRLDAGASSHICLAAEINVLPGDPLLAPSLNGGAPGPND